MMGLRRSVLMILRYHICSFFCSNFVFKHSAEYLHFLLNKCATRTGVAFFLLNICATKHKEHATTVFFSEGMFSYCVLFFIKGLHIF
jgi:hypothetical protein